MKLQGRIGRAHIMRAEVEVGHLHKIKRKAVELDLFARK